TTIVWDRKTGKPVYNAIVWQCRRTAEKIKALTAAGYDTMLREKTGLIPDAYFSGSKVAWILEHVEGAKERARRGELLFGTVDTWLIYNLTKGRVFVTDYTNASRTMLFNIHTRAWDEDILKLFDIPVCMLPEVKPSSCIYGYTDETLIGGSIPIAGAAGDQQAALFGQCCFDEGDVKNTYGTGCFLLMNTGKKAMSSENGLLTTIAASVGDEVQYALEGSVFVAGAAVQWLRDELGLIRTAAETERAACEVPDTNGVYVVPAFTGMGAPYWNPYARGMIVGLTRGAGRAHLIRATLESLAYQTLEVLQAMEKDAGIELRSLRVDGGASNNSFLMQFQSDILGKEVIRPDCIETTALGAAYLAGIAVGFFAGKDEIRANRQAEHSFVPAMDEEARATAIKGWKRAMRCALSYAEDDDAGA
ncbi:MAG: glycerol kinase GlpK, partial [Lachnospiraceae bacterium]|nr:glycerol kinase GlpK [Lachnospiraceae bacterium]